MEMAVNDRAGPEAPVPLRRGAGTPRGRIARLPRQHDILRAQRIVIDQNGASIGGDLSEASLAHLQSVRAPLGDPGVRLRVEAALVTGDDAGFGGPGNDALAGDLRGPDAVVVKQQERRDHRLGPGPRPERIGILGRGHAMAAGEIDERRISLGAAWRTRRARVRPELVITGDPDEPREARPEKLE